MTTTASSARPLAGSAPLCALAFHTAGRPALYYIHDISGSVLHFAPLARRLTGYRDVMGLQSIGLNPGYPADPTIEQMADRYLEVLGQRGHDEPCDLVGYSMGGLIAYEMATRLVGAGRKVRLLGLIDTQPPGFARGIDSARVLRMMAQSLRVESVLPATTSDPERLIKLLLDGAKAAGALPARYTADDLRPALDLQLANGRAAQVYRPTRAFGGDIRLLAAGAQALAAKTEGWRPHVTGLVLGDVVDADHFSLMQEPAAREVVEVLKRWVAGAGPTAAGG